MEYELVENDLLQLFSLTIFVNIKMSYYWFNRQELFQKAEEKYHNCVGKEKAAEYYIKNKDVVKENTNNMYNNLSKEQKEAKK